MSPKKTVKSKEKKKNKKQKRVTMKQSPVLHTGFPQVSLWGQSSKVCKGGDMVALLIRLEAKLFIFTWWTDVTESILLLQFMFQPRSVLETPPSTLPRLKGSSNRLKREKLSLSERTCPWMQQKWFFCPIYGIYFSSIFILHNFIIIKHLVWCLLFLFFRFAWKCFSLQNVFFPPHSENFKGLCPCSQ